MNCYLLDDTRNGGKLYVAFGDTAVDAARQLIDSIGGNHDTERFSVSGSWSAVPGQVIDVSAWWPYFTFTPPNHSNNPIAVIRGGKQ